MEKQKAEKTELSFHQYRCHREYEEQPTQNDCDPEEGFFNAATGRKNTTAVSSGKTAQTYSLVLQDYAGDKSQRSYN
jgi:hypothetical protein